MKLIREYALFIIGIIAIVLGYVFLATGDISFAPLLLVAGYCVLVPIFLIRAFLVRKGE